MGLDKLWSMARPIPKELELINKYTWMGVNKVLPIRYLDANDVMAHPNMPIKNYLVNNEVILLFPNIVNGVIVDLYVQPLYTKGKPLRLGSTAFPYNIGGLSPDFKYGDPIILVEGIADLAAIKLMGDLNVVAMRGNSLGTPQTKLLAAITNNIIVIPDSDEAGNQGFSRLWRKFRDLKVNIVSVNQFKNFKDTGDFIEKILYYYKTEDLSILDEIQLSWRFYEVSIETEKRNMR